MPSELLTSRDGSTLILTLSDPATRNTLSPQAYAAGVEALNMAESDDSVRAVIVRGDGEHFCAGGDLNRIIGLRQQGPAARSRASRPAAACRSRSRATCSSPLRTPSS
jgi:enoyl-CoA hydratase/carnithine racemase